MRRPLLALYVCAAVAVAGGLAFETERRIEAGIGGPPDVEVRAATVLGPRERVIVKQGMGGDAIANLLVERGVITDVRRFRTLLGVTGASSELQAGCYEIARGTPTIEVIRRLRGGLTTDRVLVIPEGLRQEEVAERAVRAGIGTSDEWASALRVATAAPGPAGRPAGAGLVGYLFPAAYPVECDTTPDTLLKAMIEAFATEVPPALLGEAQRAGLTVQDVITIASIVEREAVVKEERAVIASVYRNRLEDDIGLDADPTVQYAVATPESVARYGWWKRGLTFQDLTNRSPYNTYVHEGLPPGPIASPGFEAIEAAVRPARTDFLFFVAKGDGTHAFARTLTEHNRNVVQYLGVQ
ncbi:MAG: endolytic transglycosylase MltG [Dehalococcoidia bacterium]|nr:endolytic transglycosylase MltG [Dehalococcoidia bacterium]